jgi:hypothetical protein
LCSGRKPAQEQPVEKAKPVSMKEVIDAPDSHVDSLLKISGTLVNKGEDYFKNLQIVLKDSLGNSIPVTVWVPIEIPPMLDPSEPRPTVLYDYLDKEIELTGYLRKGRLMQSSESEYHIEVKEAEVLYEE